MANVFQQRYCPICREKVTEKDEWMITVDEDMNPQTLFHKKCYEDKKLTEDMIEFKDFDTWKFVQD